MITPGLALHTGRMSAGKLAVVDNGVVLFLVLISAFVFGTDLIIKDYLPSGVGSLLESAFRWLPAFGLIILSLLFGAPLGIFNAPLIGVFFLLLLQAVLRSENEARSFIELLRETPVYLMALVLVTGRLSERAFWIAVLAGGIGLCLLSLGAALLNPSVAYTGYEWGANVRRLEGVAPQAVSLGFVASLCFLIAINETLLKTPEHPVSASVFLIFAILAFWCLVQSQSRGPTLSLFVAFLILFSLNVPRIWSKSTVLLTVVLLFIFPLIVGLTYAILRLTPLDTLLSFAMSFGDDRMMTLAQRALIWDAGKQDIVAHPLFGQSYRLDFHIDHFLADEDGIYPSYHAAFLGLWRDAGVFAALCALAIVVTGYWKSVVQALTRSDAAYAPLRAGIMAYILVAGSLDSSLSGGVLLTCAFGAYVFSLRGERS